MAAYIPDEKSGLCLDKKNFLPLTIHPVLEMPSTTDGGPL